MLARSVELDGHTAVAEALATRAAARTVMNFMVIDGQMGWLLGSLSMTAA
jgi:hypothetical protein